MAHIKSNPWDIYVNGTAQDDILEGNEQDNFIYGVGGDDIFVGDGGADQLHGSTGTDTVYYGESDEGVKVDLQKNTGHGGDAQGDRYFSIENVAGTNHIDYLFGDGGDNLLSGFAGNDWLYGRGGNDELIGGYGNDILNGGAGADVLRGGGGQDTASYAGSSGAVSINLGSTFRGPGYVLLGGTILGGDASGDTFSSIENLTGSRYHDILLGDVGDNVIDGGYGDDTLNARDGDDVTRGGAGNDLLMAGSGRDVLDGGSGRDEVSYAEAGDSVEVDLSAGYGRHVRTGSDGQPSRFDHDELASIENVTGTRFDDKIHGDDGSNDLSGLGGNDHLTGGAGADALNGGAGSDTASYFNSSAAVEVDLASGIGSGGHAAGDTLIFVENIEGSFFHDGNRLFGNDGANGIWSWGHHDVVDGRSGADEIYVAGEGSLVSGGGGDDSIHVSWNNNSFPERTLPSDRDFGNMIDGGSGIDTLHLAEAFDFTGNVVDLEAGTSVRTGTVYNFSPSRLSITDEISSIENVIGGLAQDVIRGDDQANTFRGFSGNDQLFGRGGNDVLDGGRGADILDGGSGIDTADYSLVHFRIADYPELVGVDVSLTTGRGYGKREAEGDTLVSIENLIGSRGDDVLEGSDAANVIDGGDGDDLIDGAGGNDILTGALGADQFLFGSEFALTESHVDITDFELGVDQINLSHLRGIETFDDVWQNLTQAGDHVVFGYDDSSLTLQDTLLSNLSEYDFLI